MDSIEMVSLRSSLPLEEHAGVDAGRDHHRVGQLLLALQRAGIDPVAHLGPPGRLLSARRRVRDYVGNLQGGTFSGPFRLIKSTVWGVRFEN